MRWTIIIVVLLQFESYCIHKVPICRYITPSYSPSCFSRFLLPFLPSPQDKEVKVRPFVLEAFNNVPVGVEQARALLEKENSNGATTTTSTSVASSNEDVKK